MKKIVFVLMMIFAGIGAWFYYRNLKNSVYWIEDTETGPMRIELVTDSVFVPFGMAFLPTGEMIVTSRSTAKMYRINLESGQKDELKGLPDIFIEDGDAGLMDVLPHPRFVDNSLIYYSYSWAQGGKSTLVVERAKVVGDYLTERTKIFVAYPFHEEPRHYGNRLLLKDGYLFITMGDRFLLRDSAQQLSNHLGKIMRLREDGTIPEDNPFISIKNAKPEIWSLGHRNPQGLLEHPVTNEIWEHEHGPRGGDEINIINPALNYGWPVIGYGVGYDGEKIGEGITHHDGMEQPIYHYTPSIAPCGMTFYTGNSIKAWKGNLFLGSLALQHLNRLVLDNNRKIIHEERLFKDRMWRMRSVKQGPDGFLYVGTDNGFILRVREAAGD